MGLTACLQLVVAAEVFLPRRHGAPGPAGADSSRTGKGPTAPLGSIPAGVVRALVVDACVPEADVRAMTKAQAVQRLADFYTNGT
ncbi:hypothetical protein ACQHIV_30795 [Kribbella sp. GL6]|uniref:hypothetical protein n=1 Tax=Kribbella sp. GL6 TaxID=3419765 RepID=UPI003D063BA9